MEEQEDLESIVDWLNKELRDEDSYQLLKASLTRQLRQAAAAGEVPKFLKEIFEPSDYSNFISCRNCPNFVRESSDLKMGRCSLMPESLMSEDSGCLGDASEMMII
jgi:hypothetical protein